VVARGAAEIVGEASVLAVLSDDGATLEPVATYHAHPEMSAFIRRVLGLRHSRSVTALHRLAPDVIAGLVHPQSRAFADLHPIHALLIVPMIADRELLSTLGVARTECVMSYEKDDPLAVEALAGRAAVAIADARRRPKVLGAEDYEAIYRFSVDGVMFTVPDGRVLAANQAACEMLGLGEAEYVAVAAPAGCSPTMTRPRPPWRKRVRSGQVRTEIPMRRGNGDIFPAEVSSSIFTTAQGEVRACVIFHDASAQVALRQRLALQARQLEEQSERDPLTNLRNRRGFTQAVDEAMAIAGRERRELQPLFFDLDQVKLTDDTFGHLAGDALIRRFATTMAEQTRDVGVSVRLGGDEFVLLLFSATHDDAEGVIARIARNFGEPRRDLESSFSVGIAEWSPDSAETLEQLLERADRSMYEAKMRRRFGPPVRSGRQASGSGRPALGRRAVRLSHTLVRGGSMHGVDEHPQDELLVWNRTEVLGRVASYGVGGSGPPVVFLHGWGLSGHTYRAALKRLLARGLRVWAPALPGFDRSAALGDHATLGDYAAWVDAFCAAVGITESVVLMGHSFGGGVAIQTAHDFPERARALVLINSIGGSAWRTHGSVVQSLAERPLWDWGLHFPRDVLPLRQLRRVLPVIIDDAVPNAVRNPRAFWHTASVARHADLTDELDELKARRLPVVVLWGDRDEIVTRASFDAMCSALGGPLSATVDGSHSWMLADPDGFGEVITNMLAVALEARADESTPRPHELATLAPRPRHDAA